MLLDEDENNQSNFNDVLATQTLEHNTIVVAEVENAESKDKISEGVEEMEQIATKIVETRVESKNLNIGEALETTPIKRISGEENIPTPFKKALFWPSSATNKKDIKKPKEKLPAVATCSKWQDHQRKKQEKKEQEEKEKENRKLARALKCKKGTKASDEKMEIDKENRQEVDLAKYNIGAYVIIEYEGGYFPGLITNIKNDLYTVKAMSKSGKDWKWPKDDDILDYELKDIICNIVSPKKVNKRGLYEVPEISKFFSI